MFSCFFFSSRRRHTRFLGVFCFQAEDGIRDAQESRGLGDVYKRQGQGVHANAITSATCFSLYFLGLPGLGLSLRALWRPSSAYLFFTVKTVFLQTPNVSAISVPLFCSFARSSIRALVSSLALLCPFLTKSIRKFTSQSSSFNFSIKI